MFRDKIIYLRIFDVLVVIGSLLVAHVLGRVRAAPARQPVDQVFLPNDLPTVTPITPTFT